MANELKELLKDIDEDDDRLRVIGYCVQTAQEHLEKFEEYLREAVKVAKGE